MELNAGFPNILEMGPLKSTIGQSGTEGFFNKSKQEKEKKTSDHTRYFNNPIELFQRVS